jgi:uncharacterized cupredoxin-like copper-binding protein
MTYKSRPITNKASSAVKINKTLVQGARDLGDSKKFTDHNEKVQEGLGDRSAERKGAELKKEVGVPIPTDEGDDTTETPAP